MKEAREVDAVYIEERMLVRVSFSAKFGDGFSTKSANTPSGMATLTNWRLICLKYIDDSNSCLIDQKRNNAFVSLVLQIGKLHLTILSSREL